MSSDTLKQKNISGGVNQQAQSGGVNQNAGRDMYNGCNFVFGGEKKDLGILSEIFEYIFSSMNVTGSTEPVQDIGKFTQLKDKLELNFDDEDRKEVGEIMTKCWNKIEIVERYVQENQQVSSERIDSLVLLVKSLFRENIGMVSCNNKVEKMQIFDDIAKKFIPEAKASNPDYYSNALAIVLYFFQMCEIGKKLSIEAKPQNNFE